MSVRTRVRQDPLNGNRWQAQYFDPTAQVWFDLGDAKLTHEEATANLDLAPSSECPRCGEDRAGGPGSRCGSTYCNP